MHVIPVHARNAGAYTGAGSLTYLVVGAETTLIDAGSGEPAHLDGVRAALAEAGTPLARVVVTHGHPDHIGGARAIADAWPAASFAKFPWPEEDARYGVEWTALRDGDMVPAGDTALWVVHTPGHAPDHICLFDVRSGTLFGGDLVVNGSTVVIPGGQGGGLTRYLASLRTVLELKPRRILPGHGEPIENPAALIRSYIAHRAMRERQILDALAGGPLTTAELVGRIYRELDPRLSQAAEGSVLAHLQKLRDEGRAVEEAAGEDAPRWRLA
jgi:glyoxylase-like metal-dependent hydrolase (beta-lactamase superfamily II)